LEQKTKIEWHWGKYRWIVLGLIILSVIASRIFAPIRPEIQLPAESLTAHPLISLPVIGDIYLTNTLVAMMLVDLFVVGIALVVRSAVRRDNLVPTGAYGAIEALVETIYELTESTTGAKWAKKIFPYFFSITLVVLIANWMELIPGVDSIGLLVPGPEGNPIQQFGPINALVKGETDAGSYALVPFVRTLSTDLNFTLALAMFSVVMTQVYGVQSQGMKYFTKFWNTKTLFSKPAFGVMDWVVGLLELVSEFAKIISFTFRLFGNIFAGSVLLFVIGALVPVFAQSAFLGLELFTGAIQAFVFGMLTMVFMAQAVQGHDFEDEEN